MNAMIRQNRQTLRPLLAAAWLTDDHNHNRMGRDYSDFPPNR